MRVGGLGFDFIASTYLMAHHHRIMRTTLDIEEDILAAVKELARQQQRTAWY